MEKQIVGIGYDKETYWSQPIGSGSYEKIVAIKLSDGEVELITDAIKNIEEHGDEYYYTVGDNDKKTPVEVVTRNGSKYLRTKPNDTEDDNLTELQAFPYDEKSASD